MTSYQRITGPTAEPVTLDAAKLHLRVDGDFEDALIAALITAAREYVENLCQRAIFTQTWVLTLDTFPYGQAVFRSWIDAYAVRLPFPRVQAISSITYQDVTGTVHTLPSTAYALDTASEPARLTTVNGTSWPYPGVLIPGTIKITYTAGSFGDGSDLTKCPASIQQAMLMLIGHWYAQREAVSTGTMTPVPLAVEALLSPYRFYALV